MSYTALVVDDDEAARHICEYIIAAMGFEVMNAADGEQALLLLNGHNPDLLILDLRLPRVSGHDILHYVRESSHLKHMPVIILTAHPNAAVSGADGLLKKPVAPPMIQEAIRKHFPSI